MKKTDLTSLEGIDLLENADKTTNLLLNDNFILSPETDSHFPAKPFHHFKELKYLNLNNNHLTSLPENTFHHLPLQWLHLNGNQLTTIPTNTFQGLHILKTLSLSKNQLTNLPERAFSDLKLLSELSLSHNKLTSLPLAFHGLFNLHKLSLEGNQLTQLPEYLFQDQRNLQSLNLLGNPKLCLSCKLFEPLIHLQCLFIEKNQRGFYEDFKDVLLLFYCPDQS